MVRKRDDGRWEGRIVIGHKKNGDSIFRYLYADTQKELTAKLRQSIDAYQGVELTEQSRMTLSEWLDQWLDRRMAGTVRGDTLDGYRRDLDKHVTPISWRMAASPKAGTKAMALRPPLSAASTRPSTTR